jgi:hypothetical protein
VIPPDVFVLMLTELSASFQGAVDWNAVSAVSGAVAAVFAAVTVLVTYLGAKEQRSQRQADRRAAHYDRWISAPAFDAVHDYAEVVRALLATEVKVIADLCSANAPHGDVLNAIDKLTASCNDSYFKLQGSLTVGAEAWNDSSLRDDLRKSVEGLQDTLNEAIATLATNAKTPDFARIVNGGVASIVSIVLRHDPEA